MLGRGCRAVRDMSINELKQLPVNPAGGYSC